MFSSRDLQITCKARVKTLYSNNGKSIDRQTQNDGEQVLVEFVMTGNRSLIQLSVPDVWAFSQDIITFIPSTDNLW